MTILTDGQVATVKATIFEVGQTSILPGDVTIQKITLFNASAVEQTAILYIKERFGTSRKLRQFKLLENEGGEYLEPGETLPLQNGDSLEAETTTAAAVNFVVFGKR